MFEKIEIQLKNKTNLQENRNLAGKIEKNGNFQKLKIEIKKTNFQRKSEIFNEKSKLQIQRKVEVKKNQN